jgi:hypothetical protein
MLHRMSVAFDTNAPRRGAARRWSRRGSTLGRTVDAGWTRVGAPGRAPFRRRANIAATFLAGGCALLLGVAYWTTIPSDPLSALDADVIGGTSQRDAVVGQTYVFDGVIMLHHNPGGVVFREESLPRYPGLTLRLRTTSVPPRIGGVFGSWSTSRRWIDPSTVIPVSGRGFWAPRRHWPLWSFPVMVLVDVNKPGCWRIGNIAAHYTLGGQAFSHTLGEWQIRTPGASCAPGPNSYLLKANQPSSASG